ncbi:unnamed protein product [Callosobruchus maculatus]|uniref:Uncharacterized protein n=1 Tax=Callosobruchus maculatus TaxID=64391 RepID=A0A653BGF1_CALMS|nr:unnamed protein product [Callosobruchus maculatus]
MKWRSTMEFFSSERYIR